MTVSARGETAPGDAAATGDPAAGTPPETAADHDARTPPLTDDDRVEADVEAARRVLAATGERIERLVAAIEAGSPADLLALASMTSRPRGPPL
jgi:hypothetical protein